MEFWLPAIWSVVIAVGVLMYVIMDGFDPGIGLLFPFARGERERDVMMNSVAPIRDGNETWLVLGGGGLLAAFPVAYSTILPALYLPIILMLMGLIFRGVADALLDRLRPGADAGLRAARHRLADRQRPSVNGGACG